MVGDRLTTDVMFGNLNGMATVLVKPLEIINSEFYPQAFYKKILGKFEMWTMNRW